MASTQAFERSAAVVARAAKDLQSADAANLADLLLRVATRYPRAGVWFLAGDHKAERLTYPELFEAACHILGGLHAHGRRPGSAVALLLEDAADFIPAFWACVLGGYLPCSLVPIRSDPGRWHKHLAHVNALLGAPLLLTTGALRAALPDDTAAIDLSTLRKAPAAQPSYEATLEDPAVLVLTSGSTGNAKAVVLTHGNLLASMAGKTAMRQIDAADVTLNWISFDHIAALSESHLFPLYAGAMQLHADPASILADPLQFPRLIDRYRVSMTFTPNFLLGQINAMIQAAMAKATGSHDLSCLRHIISGGEAIVVDTAQRFLDLLAPFGLARTALWPAFGMTETCAGSIYSREFPDGDAGREFAQLGLPVNGLQMRVVDDNAAVLPDGEAGELQLRGPMVFSSYYRNEAATQAAFTADGWFRTGDLGRIESGRLSLVGRSKDSIIVSGVNYYSHELETALQDVAGIERSYVAAFPTRPKGADTEQLVVTFATTFPLQDEAKLHQLAVAVRNTTILLWGFRPALLLPLPKAAFAKTSLGKIQRGLLRQRLEAGEFAPHVAHMQAVTNRQLGGYTPPAGPEQAAIAGIYAEIFKLDPATVGATANFFDLGGASLDIVLLKRKLEQHFAVADVPLVAILQNPSVRDLAARVAPRPGRRKNAYDPVVPLQVSGHKTPLFCVHPGVGEVLVFVNLAQYFVNDRPFFALRARGFNASEEYFSSVDEMVYTYASAIRRRQPHGPYAIAGYSYGAPVAFEIAKLFESKGEQVAFVGSIDMPPRLNHGVDGIECAVNLAFFLSLIDTQHARELPAQLRAMRTVHDPCEYLLAIAPPARLAELDMDLSKFRGWAELTYALLNIGRPYEPSGSVSNMSVFYANPLQGTKEAWLNDELRRWDKFSRVPVTYIDVPGEHHAIMGPKHVGSFQAALRAELNRTLGDA